MTVAGSLRRVMAESVAGRRAPRFDQMARVG
jgi:hypothetical protein